MVLDPAVVPLAWAGGGVVRCLGRPPQVETGGRPFVSPKVSGYGLLFSFAGGSPLGPEIVQPTSSPLTISLKSSIPLPPSGPLRGHPIPDGRRLGQSAVGRTARGRLERSSPRPLRLGVDPCSPQGAPCSRLDPTQAPTDGRLGALPPWPLPAAHKAAPQRLPAASAAHPARVWRRAQQGPRAARRRTSRGRSRGGE